MSLKDAIATRRIFKAIESQWIPYLKVNPQQTYQYYDIFKRVLRRKDEPHLFRGFFDGAALKAIAVVYPVRDALFIELLLVAPDCQGQGWGRKVISQLIEESDEQGFDGVLRLKSLPAAVGFYQKLGFEIAKLPPKPEWDVEMTCNPNLTSIDPEQLQDFRHLTALSRHELSMPTRLALQQRAIRPGDSVFDYGCGRAGDVIGLRLMGYESNGWDRFYFPHNPKLKADVVLLIYVLNVIDDSAERSKVLKDAYSLAQSRLIVSVRTGNPPKQYQPFRDGYLTRLGTFQKFYTHRELCLDVYLATGRVVTAIADGIVFVNRD